MLTPCLGFFSSDLDEVEVDVDSAFIRREVCSARTCSSIDPVAGLDNVGISSREGFETTMVGEQDVTAISVFSVSSISFVSGTGACSSLGMSSVSTTSIHSSARSLAHCLAV